MTNFYANSQQPTVVFSSSIPLSQAVVIAKHATNCNWSSSTKCKLVSKVTIIQYVLG